MCGLFGFVGNFSTEQKKFLAWMNASRGEDGFGTVSRGKGWFVTRCGKSSREEMASKHFDHDYADWLKSRVSLGHTRKASSYQHIGGKSTANAHPFSGKSWVVAHNGYINNHLGLEKEHGTANDKVDSATLPMLLDAKGIEGLADVSGKAALWAVSNKETQKIWLWCWNQDLAIAKCDDGIVFSSEWDHLLSLGFPNAEKIKEGLGRLLVISTKDGKILEDTTIKGKTYDSKSATTFTGFTTVGSGMARRLNGLSRKHIPPRNKIIASINEWFEEKLKVAEKAGMVGLVPHLRTVRVGLLSFECGTFYDCYTCHNLLLSPEVNPIVIPGAKHVNFVNPANSCGGTVYRPTSGEVLGKIINSAATLDEFEFVMGIFRALEMSDVYSVISSADVEKEIASIIKEAEAIEEYENSRDVAPKHPISSDVFAYAAPAPGKLGYKIVECDCCCARLRLDMPPQSNCEKCDGTGRVKMWMCPLCLGHGFIKEICGEEGAWHSLTCKACDGSGWIAEEGKASILMDVADD